MRKPIRQRVLDSFQDAESGVQDKEQAREYSRSIYAVWKDISVALSRSALLIFLLIVAFELLASQRASAVISIGTFTLVNAPIVQIALPTIVAYVIYDSFRLTVRWLRLELIYKQLVQIYAPMQASNDIDLLIEPNVPSFWGVSVLSFMRTGNIGDSFMREVNRTVSYTMAFAVPVAFEFQAYYRLIQKFGYHNVFLWINIVITTLFGVCTALYVWFDRTGRSTWWRELQSNPVTPRL